MQSRAKCFYQKFQCSVDLLFCDYHPSMYNCTIKTGMLQGILSLVELLHIYAHVYTRKVRFEKDIEVFRGKWSFLNVSLKIARIVSAVQGHSFLSSILKFTNIWNEFTRCCDINLCMLLSFSFTISLSMSIGTKAKSCQNCQKW